MSKTIIEVGQTFGYWQVPATTLARYGTDNYSKLPECHEKMKQTNLDRYGTAHYPQSLHYQQYLIDNQLKTILPSGQGLCDYALQNGVPVSTVHQINARAGVAAAVEYIKNYTDNVYSTEATLIALLRDVFPNLQKYDKKPLEANLNYRPDFRLEKNDRVLYLNIDGLYDHSNGGRRKLSRQYHSKLAQEFANNNLRLMQFRSDELYSKPQLIRSIILNYFGLTTKLNARSCIIKELSQSESSSFFSQNHLMGGRLGASTYGLCFNDEIVAALSVRRTNNQSISIERFCSKINTTVRGAFSKLLHYIEQICEPFQIESFCDLRYASGDSYVKCGFKLSHIDTSGFVWTDFKHTYNRRQCRANMDDRKLPEAQYASEKRWYKIYDAGQAKYIKELK